MDKELKSEPVTFSMVMGVLSLQDLEEITIATLLFSKTKI
jgi:hypothetical protein